MTPDPRPARRVRDPELMRLLHANPQKQCAITGWTDRVQLHHVLPRAKGGDDSRENLVFLDADFHSRITANQSAALALLGAHIQRDRPDTVAYLRRKLGAGADEWMRRRLHIEP